MCVRLAALVARQPPRATALRRWDPTKAVLSVTALHRGQVTTSGNDGSPVPLTGSQKMRLMASSGVGMVGFGFVDNFVMIVAGDAIDANLGATLGISAIAAAGIGNTLSDTAGHYFGDAIERFAGMLGLEAPSLTEEQAESKTAESCRKHGGGIGLCLGCLLGMCPLLWTGILKRNSLTEEEWDLHRSVFAPLGVGNDQFAAAIRAGEWKTVQKGTKIIEAGKPLDKVVLVTRGVIHKMKGGECVETYAPKDALKSSSPAQNDQGFLVGGFRLNRSLTEGQGEVKGKPYPTDIVAGDGEVRYFEWKFDAIVDVCSANNELERAMLAITTRQLKMRATRARQVLTEEQQSRTMQTYKVLVAAILADAHVTPQEKEFLREYSETHNISEEERDAVLKENGWTVADLERGRR